MTDFDQRLRELKTARAKALVTEHAADEAAALQDEIDRLMGRPVQERAVEIPAEVRKVKGRR